MEDLEHISEEVLRQEPHASPPLLDVIQALLASATLDEISTLTLQHAQNGTYSPVGRLELFDNRTGEWSPPQAVPGQREAASDDSLASCCAWIKKEKSAFLTTPSPAKGITQIIPPGDGRTACLGVPVWIERELVGIIAVAGASGGYGAQEQTVLEQLAVSLALAISQARLRAELALQKEKTAKLSQEQEQIIYVISHDLQEPLRKIHSFLELMERTLPVEPSNEKTQKYMEFVKDATGRMQEMILALLQFSRISRGNLSKEDVSLEKITRQVVKGLAETLRAAGAQITVDDLPLVWGEADQLTLLLENLVGNAIKFRGAEPPRIHISATQERERCIIRVQDNGLGIAPQSWERIFGIFQRLHTRQEYPGTGIGLAICRKIVERHGGQVWLESQPGVGSVFSFTLPSKET